MASRSEYQAGNAILLLSPRLPKDFAAQVKKQLAPINESLAISLSPKLASGFKTQVATLVKGAADGVDAKVSIGAKLAVGFRKDLEAQVKKAVAGIDATVDVKANTRGIKAQIKAGTSDLPDLKLKLDLAGATRQLEQFRTLVAASPLSMSVNIDTRTAMAQIAALRSLATSAGDSASAGGSSGQASISRSGTQKLTGGIFTRPIQAIKVQIQVDKASAAKAEADVAAIASKLTTARQAQADAAGKVTLAETRYAEVMKRSGASDSARISVTQNLAKARRTLSDATSHVSSLESDASKAKNFLSGTQNKSSIGSAIGAGVSAFQSAALDGLKDAAKNAFSLTNLLGLAQVAAMGLAAVSLVPLIGQLAQAAGVVALLPAAFAAGAAVFATIKIGMSGVSDALQAAGKMAADSGQEAQEKAKTVATAQKSVATASREVTDAERGIGDAQRESVSAQNDLTSARKEATRTLEDLNREVNRGKLDEEGASISVAEAQRDLIKTLSDPKADAIDRASAQHRLNTALADQQDVITKSARAQEDANDANAKGVEGSDSVVSAKERVAKAVEGQQKAQEQLATAQTDLVDAQTALNDAMTKATPSVDAFQQKMAQLSPHARDFVQSLIDLKPQLDDFKHSIQDSLLNGMGPQTSTFIKDWLPTAKSGLSGIADEINKNVRKAMADLDSDATRSQVSSIFDNIKASIGPVVQGIDNLVQGILSLTQVGSGFLPGLSNGFLGLTQQFKTWAESPEGQTKFHDFLLKSIDTFKQFADLGGSIIKIIGDIFKGSDKTGQSWMDSLVSGAKKLSDYLATPEGQKKIQDFFSDVQKTVKGIVDGIREIAPLIDKITGFTSSFGNSSLGKIISGFTDSDKSVSSRIGSVASGLGDTFMNGTGAGWAIKLGVEGFKSALTDLENNWTDFTSWLDGDSGLAALFKIFDPLPDFFKNIVNGIGGNWGDLGNVLLAPVNTTIDILNAFGDIWNRAAGFLGISTKWTPMAHVNATQPTVQGHATESLNSTGNGGGGGGYDFGGTGGGGEAYSPATSSPVPNGTPGKDSVHGLLMPDEVVMSVPAVKAAGRDNLLRFNQAALNGNAPTEGLFSGGHVAMASGGAVQDAIDKAKSFVQGEAGKPYQYGGVGDPSWDCSGLWSGIVNVLQGRPATSGRLFNTESDFESMGWTPGLNGPVTIGIMRGGGGEDSHMAGTLEGDNAESRGGDGVLFGPQARGSENSLFGLQYTLRDFVGKYTSGGPGGGGSGGGLFGAIRSSLVDHLLATPLRALVNQVPTFNNLGHMGEIPKVLLGKVVESAISYAKGTGTAGRSTESLNSRGPAVDQVKAAFSKYGWGDGAEWSAVDWIISHESSWDPTAVNPSSGAFGLPQFLGSTKDQYLPDGSTNPGVQGDAMARYIKDRYGDPIAAQKFWQQYGWYDQGGIFPHNTIGINASGKPEAVLTNPQWKVLQNVAGNLGSNTPTGGAPTATPPNATSGTAQGDPQPDFGIKQFQDFGTQVLHNALPGNVPAPAPDTSDAAMKWAAANPGVDNGISLANKASDRFKSALDTGTSDLASSFLGPLGLPDPRDIPIVSAVNDYNGQLDAWSKAKAANVQASQMLNQTGYTPTASASAGTTAEAATGVPSPGSGTVVNNDNSTVINITTADVNGAFAKAQQISDLRALQHTARG